MTAGSGLHERPHGAPASEGARRRDARPEPARDRLAGADQLQRKLAALWRCPRALEHLRQLGLTDATLRRFRFGLAAPYQSRRTGLTVSAAVCFPLLGCAGLPVRRFGMLAVPGLTQNAPAPSWCAGEPRTYYAGPVTGRTRVLVAGGPTELWLLAQHLDAAEDRDLLVVASAHGLSPPREWMDPAFWRDWEEVYLAQAGDAAGEEAARGIARLAGRAARRVSPPCAGSEAGSGWRGFFRAGGSARELRDLMAAAAVVSAEPPRAGPPQAVPPTAGPGAPLAAAAPGEYEVERVNVNGAYVRGQLYYPFVIEHVEVETAVGRDGQVTGRTVTSYRTKVVRSDAAVLDVMLLPAPKGTLRERRVLALSDGTRLLREPQPNHRATWPLRDINAYIAKVRAGQPVCRPLAHMLGDLRAHMEAAVWLPQADDHAVLALYAALSFVYTVFDAIPLVLVTGEKGSGKTALAEAIEAVAFNAVLVGSTSAAAAIRAANEGRGLMVLDDLESVGTALAGEAFSDLHQMLKLAYKRTTGRKVVTERSGRTVEFDFFGPKVVNNTSGIDPITRSRMYEVRTRRMPPELRAGTAARLPGFDPRRAAELRSELHGWAMAHAHEVEAAYRDAVAEAGRTDRAEEIALPLRVLAGLAGDRELCGALDRALRRQERARRDDVDLGELLREAVVAVVRGGATREVSLAQLRLELRLASEAGASEGFADGQPVWRQPWWISNQLAALDLRDVGQPVGRRRLYGRLTKLFALPTELVQRIRDQAGEGAAAPAAADAFAFCTGRPCAECPYAGVCADTLEGMQAAKGRSGSAGRRGQ